jgi:hypothetical protein
MDICGSFTWIFLSLSDFGDDQCQGLIIRPFLQDTYATLISFLNS